VCNSGQTNCVSGVLGNTCVPLAPVFEGPYGDPTCADGLDNNCNGQIDAADGFCMNVCMDDDGDGYGANGAAVCTVPLVVDCDDTNPNINPSKTDTTCNGVDENCSGVNDEGYVPTQRAVEWEDAQGQDSLHARAGDSGYVYTGSTRDRGAFGQPSV